nr:reverse transcriptase domain-containing protein [Tanacetum cinerariifolium]
DFRWTTEAEQAFQQLKKHLSALSMLAAPKPQEELIMYLSATHGAISAVLLTKRRMVQTPVYFISRALQGPELNYSPMEKLVLSLVFAAKRLRRYFQAYPIAVITDQPSNRSCLVPTRQGNYKNGALCWENITKHTDQEPNQVLGTYEAKEDNMIKYLEIAKGLVSGFKTFSINQVPRSKNKKAGALRKEVTAVIEEEGPTWMTELVNYLKEGILPADEKEARKIRLKARQYELIEGILYKRSFLTPWLRCVGPLQAEYVIKEIHEGSCSMHAGPRSVVAKAIRPGYF